MLNPPLRLPVPALLLVMLLAPLAFGCASSGPAEESRAPAIPEFDGNSLTRALSVADATGRNVLIEYSSETCPFCEKMEERTLSRSEVKEGLEEVVYVQVRKGVNSAAFEARWGERNTPSYLVVRPDGAEASSIVTGLVSTSDFNRFVAWARTAEGPEPEMRTGGS